MFSRGEAGDEDAHRQRAHEPPDRGAVHAGYRHLLYHTDRNGRGKGKSTCSRSMGQC